MGNSNFTEQEEKALVGILYNHISMTTTLEVFGEITQEGIARLDTLRSVFQKLITKYNLLDAFTQENFLLLGLKNLLDKELLEIWAENDKNKHLELRAKYFLQKKSQV